MQIKEVQIFVDGPNRNFTSIDRTREAALDASFDRTRDRSRIALDHRTRIPFFTASDR